MDRKPDTAAQESARQKFTKAFDSTLISMWHEQQYKRFGRRTRRNRRTGDLILSTVALQLKSDPEALSVVFRQTFRDYGIYVDAGTGREVFRGNPGDIGRPKVRKAKPWFGKKYYLSVMNLREFYVENLGLQTVDIIAQQLDDRALRASVTRNVPRSAMPGGRGAVLEIPGTGLPL